MKARTTKEGCMVRVAIELASQRGQEGGRHMWVWEMELMQAQFWLAEGFSWGLQIFRAQSKPEGNKSYLNSSSPKLLWN